MTGSLLTLAPIAVGDTVDALERPALEGTTAAEPGAAVVAVLDAPVRRVAGSTRPTGAGSDDALGADGVAAAGSDEPRAAVDVPPTGGGAIPPSATDDESAETVDETVVGAPDSTSGGTATPGARRQTETDGPVARTVDPVVATVVDEVPALTPVKGPSSAVTACLDEGVGAALTGAGDCRDLTRR